MWFLTQEYDKKVFLKFMEKNSLKKNFTKNLFNNRIIYCLFEVIIICSMISMIFYHER